MGNLYPPGEIPEAMRKALEEQAQEKLEKMDTDDVLKSEFVDDKAEDPEKKENKE